MNQQLKLAKLTRLFAQVGLKSFGGQIPIHLWDSLVSRGWLTQKDYMEAVNWSQCVPGCNGTNLSAYLGERFRGVWGAIFATLALLLPGAIILLSIAIGVGHIPQQQIVQGVLSAVAAATVGLLVGMTWKISRSTLSYPGRLFIAAATFGLVGLLKLPILIVIFGLGWISWYLEKQGLDKDHDDSA
jgi:chromate transporter